jgi:hypothetical protein
MEPKEKFNFRIIWGALMVIIYITISVLLIFTETFMMEKNVRLIVGSLFFIYSIFRAINLIKFKK